MADFLELVETIRAEEASAQRIYAQEGQRARTGRNDPAYKKRLAEAATLIAAAFNGNRRAALTLQEAMTTSDFPLLFGDVLDRQLLANYREAPYSWNSYAHRALVRDFRTVKRFSVEGGEGTLPEVQQQAEYQETALTESAYSYAVKKYGRRLPISWETIVNDDLSALSDIPLRFGRAARRSEERFVTELFVDASGPHASFYTVGNKNKVASNAPLSIAALQSAMSTLAAMKDSDGEPIMIDAMVLVVPPALEVTAYNIVNAIQLELTGAGGTADGATSGSGGQRLIAPNWMRSRVKIAVNYYIPIVASSANGDTSWFLFADPNSGRPALEIGFLTGHDGPEVFMKAPNATRIGGGMVTEDFDNDSINYKVRHVFGGSRMDPRCSVASSGAGS